ncbi:tyrosine-type recombinase/integrase [Algoriphagus halophilus]|uniref:tyrosine-type recombinase/integrase n=1 Tax=Algoriphagus halophilus TaxID=226505 RepID=UPI00358EE48C
MIALLYGCGLRCFEVRNLKDCRSDFDRKILHVKDGKGKKDRYVPLADILIRGIKTTWRPNSPLSGCSIVKNRS